jgi:hypothetical protein
MVSTMISSIGRIVAVAMVAVLTATSLPGPASASTLRPAVTTLDNKWHWFDAPNVPGNQGGEANPPNTNLTLAELFTGTASDGYPYFTPSLLSGSLPFECDVAPVGTLLFDEASPGGSPCGQPTHTSGTDFTSGDYFIAVAYALLPLDRIDVGQTTLGFRLSSIRFQDFHLMAGPIGNAQVLLGGYRAAGDITGSINLSSLELNCDSSGYLMELRVYIHDAAVRSAANLEWDFGNGYEAIAVADISTPEGFSDICQEPEPDFEYRLPVARVALPDTQ